MEDKKQWAWKLANCTLKDILLTKTMDEVFIWFKTLWKGHWLNEKYTLQSFMISVATSNFESKCLVLNAHVRVSLLSISSKLSLVQMKLETEQQQENLKSTNLWSTTGERKKLSWQSCLNANVPAVLTSPNFLHWKEHWKSGSLVKEKTAVQSPLSRSL